MMSQEYWIDITLCLDTALHIGTGKGGTLADSPIRRTGKGEFLIPGRALGGSLRTLATRLAPRLGCKTCQVLESRLGENEEEKKEDDKRNNPCPCEVCCLFGNVNPVDLNAEKLNQNNKPAEASRLWVYDAVAEPPKRTHLRDGVGINRQRGTAASQVKFTYETVPAGTEFTWKLRLMANETVNTHILIAVLAEWEAGRGQLGGNVARGLGRFSVKKWAVTQRQIKTADDVINYLKSSATQNRVVNWASELETIRANLKPSTTSDFEKSIAGGFLVVDFTLAFNDLFLSHDPLSGLIAGFDHAPLVEVTQDPGQMGQPILSGSSLRGVLRSHAEKIARTLATNHWYQVNGGNAEGTRSVFLESCPACDVLARGKEDVLASCDARLQLPDSEETPEDALCLACRLFGSQRRGSRLWVSDAHLAKESLDKEDWKAQDFLAIDRFTGGGMHGAKFDAAPLYKAKFKGQLTLHTPQIWELGWLALLLRDLAEERLTVGFGRAKGYGRVKAEEFTWTIGYLTKEDVSPFHLQLGEEKGAASGLYHLITCQSDGWLPDGWLEAAKKWVDEFNTAVTYFQHHKEWQPFEQDSFFTPDDEKGFLKHYGVSRVEVKHG